MSSKSDVTLDVDGEKFHCNRNELAKQSPYFEAMFSDNFVERNKNVIKIQGVDAAAMRFLLEWINDTSRIDSLQGEEVLVVLQAAAMLQFEQLQHICEEIMVLRWLSSDSCLQTAATADQLSLTKLHQKAFALALWSFPEVRHTEAFFNLSADALIQYLSQNALMLGPNSDEFQVFEGVSCWLEHNLEDRYAETLKVLSCVRMNFISTSDIQSMLNYACIDSCKDAQLLLHYVMCIKEGKKIVETNVEAVEYQEEGSLQTVEEKYGCCDTLRKIADHIRTYNAEAPPSQVDAVIKMPDDNVKENQDCSDQVPIPDFNAEILLTAQKLLSFKKRCLPYVPCVIGRIVKAEEQTSLDEGDHVPGSNLAKKNRKDKTKSALPHIFYLGSDKSERPIPLLPLSKISQGATEALGYSVVSRGQELFVIGGEYLLGHGNWNKSVWKYNVWSETWTFETSLTVPRRHHSVVCIDNDMYIIGGFGKFRVIMDSMDRYNFDSRTWNKCAPLPTSLYSAATCLHNNAIYVISSQIFCYYPRNNSWVTLSDISIPTGASFNKAMSYGEHIYLTGPYSSDLMSFDPIQDKSIKCIGSFQNTASEACIVEDRIFSFTEDDERSYVEMYDIQLNTFRILWKTDNCEGDEKISFKKSGGCFPLVLYETLWGSKNL